MSSPLEHSRITEPDRASSGRRCGALIRTATLWCREQRVCRGCAIIRPPPRKAVKSISELVRDQEPDRPELFFGISSAVGTPLQYSLDILKRELAKRQYQMQIEQLRDFTRLLRLTTPEPPPNADEFTRTWALMDRGNEARKIATNDILAGLAVAVVNEKREKTGGLKEGQCVVFRQLKHPAEAYLLRQVYDEGFHLIGMHCPRAVRMEHLTFQKGMTPDQATELVDRDEFESEEYGQRVRETFHLSDVFIQVTGKGSDEKDAAKQLARFLDLLFGDGIHTPTRDEYGMFLAYASGLRSAQLSRQVGAAILSRHGEVLSVGCNEVPRAGGGQYWEGGAGIDGRDHALPNRDSTDAMKIEMIEELLDALNPEWRNGGEGERDLRVTEMQEKLKHTRMMNLTEFGRAVHAEMEAISAAARVGAPLRGATLYTTTFPCHNCTKHIVAAGIGRVVYIEPYPKSLAQQLHGDAVKIEDAHAVSPGATREATDNRVTFEPFVGVAPRRFAELFAMTTKAGRAIRRKDKKGKPLPSAAGMRLKLYPGSYLDIEAGVARAAAGMTTTGAVDDQRTE